MRLPAVLQHVQHNVTAGFRLTHYATDLRSRVLLFALAMSLTLKQRTRWKASTVCVKVRIGGQPFPVRLGTHSDIEVLHEIVIFDEYGDLPIGGARVIVDLGAHIGLSALRLLVANPGSTVLAVEADPYLIAQLNANVAGLPITVVNAAVSSVAGNQTFYRSETFSWANSLHRTMPQQQPVTVRGATLDQLMADAGIDHIDLLKVDIEGAEWEVFPNGFPEAVDAVVGELHASSDGRPPRVLADIMARNMEMRRGREDDSKLVFQAARQKPQNYIQRGAPVKCSQAELRGGDSSPAI